MTPVVSQSRRRPLVGLSRSVTVALMLVAHTAFALTGCSSMIRECYHASQDELDAVKTFIVTTLKDAQDVASYASDCDHIGQSIVSFTTGSSPREAAKIFLADPACSREGEFEPVGRKIQSMMGYISMRPSNGETEGEMFLSF